MGREIKFRLWDKKDNKMRYQIGSIRFDIDNFLPFSVSIPSGARNSRLVNDSWIEEDGTHSPNEQKGAELMQFTGLHDKNGTEIYEGDIVKTYSGEIGEIVFRNGMFQGKINNKWGQDLTYPVLIIGNIYENTELLEQTS